MALLDMRFLGGIDLFLDEQPLSKLKSKKGKGILCYLSMHGQDVPRPVLAGLFWSDMPESQALMNLRKTLQRLKPVSRYLIASRENLRFNREMPYQLDVARFQSLASQTKDFAAWQEAISLYKGDFLAGFYTRGAPLFEEWVLAQRGRLHERYLQTLGRLVSYCEAHSQIEQAARYAKEFIRADPFNEELQRDLMRLLAMDGQRGAALAAYEALAAMLQEELGVVPDQMSKQLYEEIKVGKWTAVSATRPAPTATETPAHNLPAQSTPFFGRDQELNTLSQWLSGSEARLITVLGPGGMGKTRLTLTAAAAKLQDGKRFAQGIFFVPLAGLESAETLPQAIAEALNFQFSGADKAQDQLLRYLKSRQMLLVLDNFEHLLAGVGWIEAILQSAPGLKLLVSSRQKLNLTGEHVLPIQGLKYPQKEEPSGPDEALRYPALALFWEQARTVRPAFQWTADNLSHVIAICRQVQGMPLGIILSASWIDTLTAGQISREIGRDLDFLKAEMGDLPPRQRSLRAAFNHSWKLLNEAEQAVFSQLSLFRGGFTAGAAQSVSGASLRILQHLVNKSLITRLPAHGEREARFEVHELLRQFAAQKLAQLPALESAGRRKHRATYCTLLKEHEGHWHSEQQLETMQMISQESDNISAAWRDALKSEDWPALSGAIDSWANYHLWQGLFQEGQAVFAELQERLIATGQIDSAMHLSIMWTKAVAWQGQFIRGTEDALAKLAEGLDFLQDQAAPNRELQRLKAFLLRLMVWRLLPISIPRARRLAEQALQLSEQTGDQWQAAESTYLISLLDWRLGNIQRAHARSAHALSTFRRLGDQRMEVRALTLLGWIVQSEGDLDWAIQLRYQSLELCRKIDDRPNLIYCLGDLSYTLHLQGRYTEGLKPIEQSVALCLEHGMPDKIGLALEMQGNILMHLGQFREARNVLNRALSASKESGNQDVTAGIYNLMGLLALTGEAWQGEAHHYLAESLRLNEPTGERYFLSQKLCGMAIIASLEGSLSEARSNIIKALNLEFDIRDPFHLVEVLASTALYLSLEGEIEQGLKIWGLVNAYPLVSQSRWYQQVIGQTIDDQAVSLPEEEKRALLEEGKELELWHTAEALLSQLR